MADVSRIGGLPTPQRPEDAARAEAERRRARAAQGTAAPAADGVAISPEARRAAEALRFAEFARAEPDVRPDRVEAARERLDRGELDRPEVVRRAVQRLLEDIV